ncbi:orotate phosphoribosyltransferase [Kutzneria buriramensis]|uniref:Orotate phosphoribosyltransferase n=1 Tax=Kutzneria buriramensis TaxID=1045776 RepID=A0A3E0HLN2_9PSEU|nr:orotate phosphoribosyltransferase [Kutzneria buriramensis]REH47116.1 orotate phosphoribosyltransferase [Kutzneria buriramensis]
MPDADLLDLARDIDRCCRLRGSFTLRSGTVATEYFDKYLFEADPVLLRRIAERMTALIPDDAQALGGLELGGVPLATMISQLTGLPTLFIRKQAKEYSTRRLAEDGVVEGRRVVLVEDVITTGGAVLAAARALREGGATVDTVVCAVDRSGGDTELLTGNGIGVRSVLTKALLDTVGAA